MWEPWTALVWACLCIFFIWIYRYHVFTIKTLNTYVPGLLLSVVHVLSHLIFKIVWDNRYCCYTRKNRKVKHFFVFTSFRASKWQGWTLAAWHVWPPLNIASQENIIPSPHSEGCVSLSGIFWMPTFTYAFFFYPRSNLKTFVSGYSMRTVTSKNISTWWK